MYNHIVVPLDGSPFAESVLPYARGLARGLRIPVKLLSIIDLTELMHNVPVAEGFYLDSLAQAENRKRVGYLTRIAQSFAKAVVECEVEQGDPASVIIESAAPNGSLLCMANRGRSGLERPFLGSVAEKVLHGVRAPVLLIRASQGASTDGEKWLDGVMVTLDGSAFAEQILPFVAALAKQLELEVDLFLTYELPYEAYAAGRLMDVKIDTPSGQIQESAQKYLEKQCGVLRQAGLSKIYYAANEGYCAYEIVRHARNNPNKLIAMCSRDRSAADRSKLPSVAETVAQHSGNPVLIVRQSVIQQCRENTPPYTLQ